MTEAIFKGLGLGLILAVSVGPVIFTILKQSINNGHQGGFSFVGGVWVSDIIWVLISNLFSSLVMELLNYKVTIGVIGAIFVFSLGIFYVFFKKVKVDDNNVILIDFGRKDFTKAFMSGFIINTLNPSVIFFWLINTTAFASSHSVSERIVLFSVCLGINIIADILKVVLAAKIRHKLNPHNISIINKVSGAILIIFAISIAYGILFLNK
jgi:threonine/homoserine/homoserine lactone efflux protein